MQNSRKSIIEAGTAFFAALVKQCDADKAAGKKITKLPEDIYNALKEGKKEFAYAEFYFRKRLSAISAGIIDIIKSTDVLTAGERNFDKGILPIDVYMSLVSVQVNYAFDSNSTTGPQPSAQNYSNSEYFNTIHKQFRNSDFRLKAGNRPILECLTKTFLADSLGGYAANANEENGLMLPTPKLLGPKAKLEAQIEFPSNSVTATSDSTNNHSVEIIMRGVKLVDRVEA